MQWHYGSDTRYVMLLNACMWGCSVKYQFAATVTSVRLVEVGAIACM